MLIKKSETRPTLETGSRYKIAIGGKTEAQDQRQTRKNSYSLNLLVISENTFLSDSSGAFSPLLRLSLLLPQTGSMDDWLASA